jgi:hypothetical protein
MIKIRLMNAGSRRSQRRHKDHDVRYCEFIVRVVVRGGHCDLH